jgi:hypothetical protein
MQEYHAMKSRERPKGLGEGGNFQKIKIQLQCANPGAIVPMSRIFLDVGKLPPTLK